MQYSHGKKKKRFVVASCKCHKKLKTVRLTSHEDRMQLDGITYLIMSFLFEGQNTCDDLAIEQQRARQILFRCGEIIYLFNMRMTDAAANLGLGKGIAYEEVYGVNEQDQFGFSVEYVSDGIPVGYGSVTQFIEMAKLDRLNPECICFKCDKQGHWSDNCFKRPKDLRSLQIAM